MRFSRIVFVIFLLSFFLNLPACLNFPRESQEVDSYFAPIVFWGYSKNPEKKLTIWAKSPSNAEWKLIDNAHSGSEVIPDPSLVPVYEFRENLPYNNHKRYWKPITGGEGYEITFNVRDGDVSLHTFHINDNSCMEAHKEGGLGAIIQNCAEEEPTVTVKGPPCGNNGQSCCPDGSCKDGMGCDDNGYCRPCGQVGAPCCNFIYGSAVNYTELCEEPLLFAFSYPRRFCRCLARADFPEDVPNECAGPNPVSTDSEELFNPCEAAPRIPAVATTQTTGDQQAALTQSESDPLTAPKQVPCCDLYTCRVQLGKYEWMTGFVTPERQCDVYELTGPQ